VSILVVGGGAIGLLVAGRLAESAVPDVGLLGRPGTAGALAEHPLRVVHAGTATAVPQLQVAGSPDDLPGNLRRPGLAILCVKGYDTPAAIATLREVGPAQVLSLQNGIGNEERLAAAFGANRVIAGAITTSVDLRGPGEIVVTKVGGIVLAPMDPAIDLAPWQAALAAAGFRVETRADPRALKWSKALLNMLGNASAAILDMPVAQIYADQRLLDLDLRAVREALAVMRHMGARPINLPGYPAGTLAAVARVAPDGLLRPLMRRLVAGGRGGKDPSLLRDLRAGRGRSEGELLYGAVAEEAARRGVPAPVNAALWRVLGGIAAGRIPWDEFRGKPERLLAELA
jgi:2-dehydropantoate 2-reductase